MKLKLIVFIETFMFAHIMILKLLHMNNICILGSGLYPYKLIQPVYKITIVLLKFI